MNIFGHQIARDQIIGISPLFKTPEGLVKQKVGFDLYLKNYSVRIESDPMFPVELNNFLQDFEVKHKELSGELELKNK